MQVYIGADHAGFQMKEALREHMKERGHQVVDLGTFHEEDKVDYPDVAREVAEKVRENPGSRGVLICGTGIGVCMVANKMKGIRAANVHDTTEARYTRLHNDANIVTMGQRIIGSEVAKDIVDVFMSTDFEGGRHEARVQKINAMDNAN